MKRTACCAYPQTRRVGGLTVLISAIVGVCRDDDAHEWADDNGLERLGQCEWGWHPGRDWRVPHVPSFKSEVCL